MKRKDTDLKRIIRENLQLLTENVVCKVEERLCNCEYSLPSQMTTCTGERVIYCSGGFTDDCTCCGGAQITGGGYLEPIYKKSKY